MLFVSLLKFYSNLVHRNVKSCDISFLRFFLQIYFMRNEKPRNLHFLRIKKIGNKNMIMKNTFNAIEKYLIIFLKDSKV